MTAGTQNVTPNSTNNVNDEEVVTAPLGLKILVVGLGVAIVGMLALMGYKIMSSGVDEKGPVAAVKTQLPPSTIDASVITGDTRVNAGFGDLVVKRPDGSELVNVDLRDGAVLLQFNGASGQTIVLIDRLTGKQSSITIPK